MSSNPATLAASRAMLSRNNSVQSNLSAAAAAAALKRASTHSASQQDLPTQMSPRLQRRLSASSLTGDRPGLHRRGSSMSERSFREKSPEEAARERSGLEVTPEKPKRRGSFSLPMSLRSNSQQKKDKGLPPGVIQPLPGQGGASSGAGPAQKKLKTSMREGRAASTPDARSTAAMTKPNRDSSLTRAMSPPTHSAMKLPHTPGIGSAASSIRSFQTDLSSIAEDSAFDPGHPPAKAPTAHLYPIKSAMKGGSGPPSIISEAVSEDSKSSIGVGEAKKGKARVSFSDEQKQQQEANAMIMKNGKVAKANSTASTSRKGSATKEGIVGKDGLLKPVAGAAAGAGAAVGATALARSLSAPASPPISPAASPEAAATVPQQPGAKTVLPVVPVTSIPTPPQSQTSTEPSQSPVVPEDTPAVVVNGPTGEPSEPTSATGAPAKPKIPTQATPPKPIGPVGSAARPGTRPVTIHVSPARSLPQKQARLPGSFPDPTPDPTPPSTADSVLNADDEKELSDTLSPLPASPRSPRPPTDELDLQRGLSMKTLALVPEGAASPTPEKIPSRLSEESVDSGTSAYSDAMEGGISPVVTQESKMAGVGIPIAAAAAVPLATKKPTPKPAQPKSTTTKKPKVNGDSSSKLLPAAIGTGAAAIPAAAAYLAATNQTAPAPKKRPQSLKSPTTLRSPGSGTTTPRAPGSVRNVRTSLRENGPSTLSAPRTTLRSSSVPPLASPPSQKKVFRTSMRNSQDEATELARGLMAIPAIERVPSDSSFKRLRPRESSVIRTTLREPKTVEQPLRRRGSDSSSEVRVATRNRSSSLFGRFKRKDSIDQMPAAARVGPGSRFEDSDDELPLPGRGIGRGYEDTESLPSPRIRKRGSITNFFFGRTSRAGSEVSNIEVPGTSTPDLTHRRSSSGSKITSKRTGKEKKFQGLRKLFRIRE